MDTRQLCLLTKFISDLLQEPVFRTAFLVSGRGQSLQNPAKTDKAGIQPIVHNLAVETNDHSLGEKLHQGEGMDDFFKKLRAKAGSKLELIPTCLQIVEYQAQDCVERSRRA